MLVSVGGGRRAKEPRSREAPEREQRHEMGQPKPRSTRRRCHGGALPGSAVRPREHTRGPKTWGPRHDVPALPSSHPKELQEVRAGRGSTPEVRRRGARDTTCRHHPAAAKPRGAWATWLFGGHSHGKYDSQTLWTWLCHFTPLLPLLPFLPCLASFGSFCRKKGHKAKSKYLGMWKVQGGTKMEAHSGTTMEAHSAPQMEAQNWRINNMFFANRVKHMQNWATET